MTEDFDVRLVEDVKSYTPDPQYRKNAWMSDYKKTYAEFMADPDGFWERKAKELDWIKPWDTVKEWNYPYVKWFTNARLNITANCLDRHVNNSRRNKVALIWKGEEGRERIFTYQKLLSQVGRFANGLKKIGVKKGDCVCIYMPLVPEQIIAMLACARIGAVHYVVFGGFGAQALNMRIQDAGAKVVITADISIRRGKAIQLKAIVDEAVLNTPWGNASVWRGHSLLSTFHNDTRGGEKFFVLLKEAAQDPAANRDLLELMYVCLALGFQGRYLVIDRGAEQLEELRARLFQILRAQRGEPERDLSPHWQGIVDRRNPLMRFVPLWVVAAVAAVLLLGLYVALSFSLNAASDPVFAQLHGLKVSRQAAVVRPPEPATPAIATPAPAPKRPLRLRELLAPEIQQQLVDLKESPDRVTVIVRGDSLFRSGSAELAPAYAGLFQRVGEALDEVPGKVVVTDHTDNVPIRSVRFPSNWHLSQERALAVQKVVAERIQAKGRLTAEGRADTEPLSPNDSPANRARNRRVEVTLLTTGGGA
jgi:type VI secretion system peptidoglycan-associated protein